MEVQNHCLQVSVLRIELGGRAVIQDQPDSVKYPELICNALRLSLVLL